MTNKDKVIAAFLVSLGIFSVSQAALYVAGLSCKEKSTLSVVATKSSGNLTICEGSEWATSRKG